MKTLTIVPILIFCSASFGQLPADFYRDSIQPIFDANCVGCHQEFGIGEFGTGGGDSGLILNAPDGYDRLVNFPSYGDTGKTMRVVPGSAAQSALYNKITSQQDETWYGDPMPAGYALINSDTAAVDAIFRWIEAGAPAPTPTVYRTGRQYYVYLDRVNHLLNISAPSEIRQLRVYNAQGKLIQSLANMPRQLSLSYNNWVEGIYFTRIETQQGSQIQKLVVNQ